MRKKGWRKKRESQEGRGEAKKKRKTKKEQWGERKEEQKLRGRRS